MTIEVDYRYPVSTTKLYKKLTDPAFLQAKYESVGSRKVDISECGLDDDVFRIEWTREVPSNPPGFARKFLAEWNRLEEIMEWSREADGSVRGDYEGQVTGFPGKLQGEFDIVADAEGCVERIRMRAVVSIPLLGKKIASFVEEDARRSLEGEDAYTRAQLAPGKRRKR